MSDSVNLTTAASLPLTEIFAQCPNSTSISLTEEQLIFAPSEDEKGLNNLELVVFSDLTLKQLTEIVRGCQLKLNKFNTKQERLGKTAFRLNVTANDLASARATLTDYCLSNQLEAALVENAPSLNQPGLLVMDMDSTTIEIECIDEIAKLAGVGEQVAEVTERAMQGELDFAQSLHQRVATLADSPESILATVAKDIPLMGGLETLISELKKYDWKVAIASGGFTYFADHLKEMLTLDDAVANTLEIVDGKLTGKVLGQVVDAQVKADTLNALAEKYAIPASQTVAMGDGANDLVMMAAANLGVAFRAKPIVQAKADSTLNQSGLEGMIHWLS